MAKSIFLLADGNFIGVWDTVDAYGMPIDALKMAIDKWFWPMTLADRNFPDDVQCACHALSLDDERPTFRPVLWTEPGLWPERLTQVWFANFTASFLAFSCALPLSFGDLLAKVLPAIRTKLQLAGLAVTVVAWLLVHFAQPGKTDEFRVAHGRLDGPMTQVALQCPGIGPFVC